MTSLFDGIFQLSGDLPVNSLFSSNNKFKSVKVASVGHTAIADGGDHTTADAAAAGKAAKTAKRKAAEPAEKPASDTGHKRNKAVASSHKKQKSDAQKLQSKHDKQDSVKEPQLRKRKRPEAESNVASEASPVEANEMRNEWSQETVDASAIHEAAAQRLTPEEEAAKLRRTVFVGNLPSDIKKKLLQKEFGQYGSIESIRKRSVPVKLDAKMSRKAAIITGNISENRGTIHAYIVFHEEPAALAALASNMHLVGGLHIRVDRAGQSAHGSAGGSVMYERNRTVFVGNLPFDVEDEELITFFNENCTKLGIQDPVDAVRVVRDSASQLGKGFGFVQFIDQAAARAALGCDGQPLRQRPIRVTRAVKVPAHLKDMGKAKPGKGPKGKDVPARKSPAGADQGGPNKAVAALQRKAEPAENWQGFKTKGSKKTVAAAITKSTGTGQRAVEGKRKSSEKRPSVVMRKQRSLAK